MLSFAPTTDSSIARLKKGDVFDVQASVDDGLEVGRDGLALLRCRIEIP